MAGASEWPTYKIGPRDSIFALGVASCNFAELEGSMHFIFSTIFNVGTGTGGRIVSKVGNEAAIDLMRRQLPKADHLGDPALSPDTTKLIEYFISGFDLCLRNRNHLMHSNFAWFTPPVLYKTTKQGLTQLAAPNIETLRQVADDIRAYAEYGRSLGNAINNRLFVLGPFPPEFFPWPDKPPEPQELHYSSAPLDLGNPPNNQRPPGSSRA